MSLIEKDKQEKDEKKEKDWYKKMWSVKIDEDFKRNVDLLPDDLKKKLYICCIKIFWRNYVPLTGKVPSWYDRKIKVERELYDAREKNIHFMHLSFNTLPENKRWIMGCQCLHCKEYGTKGELGKVYKDREYRKLLLDPSYFHNNISLSKSSDWNNHISLNGVKYFDPFFDSEYENIIIQCVRKNKPIDFYIYNDEILEFTFEIDIDEDYE